MTETSREPEDIVDAFLMGKNSRELTEEETLMAVEAMAAESLTRLIEVDSALLGQIEVSAAVSGNDNVRSHIEHLLKRALSQEDHQGIRIERVELAYRNELAASELTKPELEVLEKLGWESVIPK